MKRVPHLRDGPIVAKVGFISAAKKIPARLYQSVSWDHERPGRERRSHATRMPTSQNRDMVHPADVQLRIGAVTLRLSLAARIAATPYGSRLTASTKPAVCEGAVRCTVPAQTVPPVCQQSPVAWRSESCRSIPSVRPSHKSSGRAETA
jgi:hypothetical protein